MICLKELTGDYFQQFHKHSEYFLRDTKNVGFVSETKTGSVEEFFPSALKEILKAFPTLVLFGGSVLRSVFPRANIGATDLDLVFIEPDGSLTEKRMEEFLSWLIDSLKVDKSSVIRKEAVCEFKLYSEVTRFDDEPMKSNESEGYLMNIKTDERFEPLQVYKIQILMTSFPSYEDLFEGIDLAPSACLFNSRGEIWISKACQESWLTRTLEIGHGKIRSVYRLLKYCRMGFDLLLPQLDVRKLPYCSFDGWFCSIKNIQGYCIEVRLEERKDYIFCTCYTLADPWVEYQAISSLCHRDIFFNHSTLEPKDIYGLALRSTDQGQDEGRCDLQHPVFYPPPIRSDSYESDFSEDEEALEEKKPDVLLKKEIEWRTEAVQWLDNQDIVQEMEKKAFYFVKSNNWYGEAQVYSRIVSGKRLFRSERKLDVYLILFDLFFEDFSLPVSITNYRGLAKIRNHYPTWYLAFGRLLHLSNPRFRMELYTVAREASFKGDLVPAFLLFLSWPSIRSSRDELWYFLSDPEWLTKIYGDFSYALSFFRDEVEDFEELVKPLDPLLQESQSKIVSCFTQNCFDHFKFFDEQSGDQNVILKWEILDHDRDSCSDLYQQVCREHMRVALINRLTFK